MDLFAKQLNNTQSWTEMQIGSKQTNKKDIIEKLPALSTVNNEEFPCEWLKAKFFILKSFNEENLFKAIKYNVWCSTA